MNTEPNQKLTQIQVEAAQWVARLNSGEVTQKQQQQFKHWIAQSPAHRQEFFNMREIMTGLGHAVDNAKQTRQTRLFTWAPLATAACLLLVVTAIFHNDVYYYWLADHITAVGEQKSLILADDSTLYLNTDSAIKIKFNAEQRRLELLKGEAEFVVAHDTSRPFVVSAGNETVTALGTDFSVRKLDNGINISVFENAVQINHDNELVAIVEQGQKIYLPQSAPLPQIMALKMEQNRAWRNGELIFTAKPLREVIAEINRYRHSEILLLAGDAATKPVSGIFAIEQLDDAVAVIADTLSLQEVDVGGLVTVLY